MHADNEARLVIPQSKKASCPTILSLTVNDKNPFRPGSGQMPLTGNRERYTQVVYTTLITDPQWLHKGIRESGLEVWAATWAGGILPDYDPHDTGKPAFRKRLQDIVFEGRFHLPERIKFIGGATPSDHKFLVRYTLYLDREPELVFSPLTKDSPLAQEIERKFKFVFRRYHEDKVVSKGDIQAFGETESALSPTRKTIIAFEDPVTGETKGMVRVYDGSLYRKSRSIRRETPAAIPVEREFPHLEIPERKLTIQGNAPLDAMPTHIFEFGRGAGESDSKGVLTALFSSISRVLVHRFGTIWPGQMPFSKHSVIYISCTEAARDAYQAMGFKVAYGPKQLRIPEGKAKKYVLKMTMNAFIRRYGEGIVLPYLRASSP